ncbi:helix-turn-helix transcriptional regulator [Salegentibacter sp. BDJ18]|uniref:helix-turn-helix domain-containing protein n=1 Tax=Salegentibacter sp. BDJ18 TaxID=2816376 RepID=UPI001AAF911F|nr:helix-turn-helix transcriptional regulator [Salegentibacter sp. BDJ18]MBO2543609.1 helix-turn-helix transcriptional regulator [Salegentibacter sp. BDJ18]
MSFPKNNIIDNWLEENGDPEIEKLTERNLAISNKVQAILDQRGIKQKEFAEMLGKKPSEVSKWLTGLHNLTLKSITKMEVALDIDLISIEPVTEYRYVYLGSVKGDGLEEDINDYEETSEYQEAI